MANRLPADLLRRSPQEASRLLLMSYLDEIGRAQERLVNPADLEALHDFRVGLRRLRSCLRAYRPFVKGSVSGKVRSRLRSLTRETNAGRDTEVQLMWLRDQAASLAPHEAQGQGWLVGRLEGRRSMLVQATANVGRRFRKLESRLRPRLLTFELEVSSGTATVQPPFGEVAAELIRQYAQELCDSLDSVRHVADQSEAHATRIRAKRLRYLMEPLSPRLPRLKGYLKRLKALQNALGTLHDMQVMIQEMPNEDGAEGIRPGLAALRQRAQNSAESSLVEFQTTWTSLRAASFQKRIGAVADSLLRLSRGRASHDPIETTDAPAPLVKSWAEAPSTTLTLETTPLPLRFPLQPRQRLR